MKWLRKILGLCVHDFEILEEVSFKRHGLYHGKIYMQKCKHCGKMQNHVVDVLNV